MADVLHFYFYVNIATLQENSENIYGVTFTSGCVRGSLGFFSLCFLNYSGIHARARILVVIMHYFSLQWLLFRCIIFVHFQCLRTH